ncbi:MAG: hypothetical protein GXO83_02385 [Chlorobi bacterium]|nr:hypothetical protein [Chlorobiota bacterium]
MISDHKLMQEINKVFNRVAADNLSGSGGLLRQLIQGLLECCSRDQHLSMAEKRVLEHILIDFLQKMQDFAIIRHFTDRLLNHVQSRESITFGDICDYVLSYRQSWSDVQTRQAIFFLNHFPLKGKTILTHSQSSTVQEIILAHTNPKELRIIQTESRPAMEGRRQARKLAESGFEVILITDTGYTPLLKDTEMVLLGADTVYSDIFINKCGTWALALLARKHDIPVYVVADSRKFIKEPAPPELIVPGNKPPEEILEFPPDRVNPLNHYFEAIPTRSVTAFITEDHIIPGQEMPLTALEKK